MNRSAGGGKGYSIPSFAAVWSLTLCHIKGTAMQTSNQHTSMAIRHVVAVPLAF